MSLNVSPTNIGFIPKANTTVEGASNTVSFAEVGSKFGTQANDYEKGRNDYDPQIYGQIVKEIGGQNPNNVSALDLGCGTGISTRGLFKAGFLQVKGLDRDSDMLSKAVDNPEIIVPASSYVQGKVNELQTIFYGQQFDVMTAFASFHWYANHEAVRAIKGVLKPGGIFVIVGGLNQTSPEEQAIQDRFWGLIADIKGSPVQHPKASADYDPIKILEECGFTTSIHNFESQVLSSFEKACAKNRSFSGWCNMTEGQKEKGDIRLQQLIRDEIARQNRPDGLLSTFRTQNVIVARLA